MRSLFCSALFLLTFSLNAQAPTAVAVKDEPHHHLVLENSYVRVFRVNIPANDATLMHQHDLPYVFVSLGPGDFTNAVAGKPEVEAKLADGQVGYSRGGFAHIARTDHGLPFNNVTVELLHSQGEARNICAQILVGAPEGECPRPTTMPGTARKEPLLETRSTFVDLVALDPSLDALSIRPQSEVLIVFLGETQIQGDSINAPTKKVVEGDVIWVSGESGETIWNSKKKDLRFLQLTFSAAVPKS
jgi:hypothetical protein